jgi:hypothetical protein
MIVVKFDLNRAPLYHLLEWFLSSPTLSMLIIAPRVHFPVLHKCECMCRPAWNGLDHENLLCYRGSLRNETLDQDRGTLLLRVRVLYTELALGIRAHCVDQLSACYEDWVGCTAWDLDYRDVIRAKPGYHVDLSLSRDLLAKAKLAEAVRPPWKNLGKIWFIRILDNFLSYQPDTTPVIFIHLLCILRWILPLFVSCDLGSPCRYVVAIIHHGTWRWPGVVRGSSESLWRIRINYGTSTCP